MKSMRSRISMTKLVREERRDNIWIKRKSDDSLEVIVIQPQPDEDR